MLLKEYIDDRGIGIKDFSERLGITRRGAYHIINREGEPKLSTAIRIIDFCEGKVTYKELLPPDIQE